MRLREGYYLKTGRSSSMCRSFPVSILGGVYIIETGRELLRPFRLDGVAWGMELLEASRTAGGRPLSLKSVGDGLDWRESTLVKVGFDSEGSLECEKFALKLALKFRRRPILTALFPFSPEQLRDGAQSGKSDSGRCRNR